MNILNFFKISSPSACKVPADKVQQTYKSLRNKTFWGATSAYSLFYFCRMAFNVIKQPVIDDGLFTESQLGIIGSTLLFVYAAGKFLNGFIADYCNTRRFMAFGLTISAILNLALGLLGLFHNTLHLPPTTLFIIFVVIWGINGWMQSMGSPPGIISLSRWFPISQRGIFFSIFCATPYFGKFLSFILTGAIVVKYGWQFGFIFAGFIGFIGSALILLLIYDTPESVGLPSVQELSSEPLSERDKQSTKTLQKSLLLHPGIWIIAISSAFVYITQYGVTGWGVLFLQRQKGFTLTQASQIISFAEVFGVVGTISAAWFSDKLFKGNRTIPVLLSGLLCLLALGLFLFTGGNYNLNIAYISLFSLSIGLLYCIVAGLMALDIVPRKATGAALGIVGISSYLAAGIQDIASGFMIQTGGNGTTYDFSRVALFWLTACLLSFALPLFSWKFLKKNTQAG